jgi:hypothetical protein
MLNDPIDVAANARVISRLDELLDRIPLGHAALPFPTGD